MKRAMGLYLPFLSTDRLRRGEGGLPIADCQLPIGEERAPSTSSSIGNRKSAIGNFSPGPLPYGRGTESRSAQGLRPLVTIAPRANVLRVVHVDEAAWRLGIRPGQALADAKAMVPHIGTVDDDPAADRGQLDMLALWASVLSPVVHLEDADTLILDATGCGRLFGGEGNLLWRAVEGLGGMGFTVRAAIADTPGAVWALTHAHPDPVFLSEPGCVIADLSPLPPWSLRIDAKTAASLSLVGVETVGSLLHLPRSSLALRFGEGVLDRIDQALGELPEPLTPYRPKPMVTQECHFGAPTERLDVLHEGVRRTLRRFCDDLTKRVAGASEVLMTFHCVDEAAPRDQRNRPVTIPVHLSRPTRSAGHLESLLLTALDSLRLPAPAESLTIWARHIDSLDDWQDELFVTDARDAQAVGDLVDRLTVRLGPEAVVRPEAVSEHQPERAYRNCRLSIVDCRLGGLPIANFQLPIGGERSDVRSLPIGNRQSTIGDSSFNRQSTIDNRKSPPIGNWKSAIGNPIRPLRLAPRPIEIAATAIVPDGPPIAFRAEGGPHAVETSIGPERIETGWWRGPHVRRDYYRVTTSEGRRFWLFRDRGTGRWFLHGWFD